MEYIITKRFRETVESGPVNLKYGTKCESRNGRIYHDGKFLVRERSRLAHTHFARNDDGMGEVRAMLTRSIEQATGTASKGMLDRMGASELCRAYRKKEHRGVWLWSHEFFIAPVEDLRAIAESAQKGC